MEQHKNLEKKDMYTLYGTYAILFVAALVIFNQFQISAIAANLQGEKLSLKSAVSTLSLSSKGGDVDLSDVDITQIQNTAQAIAAVFPIDKIKTTEDAMAYLFPTGTPDYGEEMGVSFDDPVGSLNKMAKAYPALKKQAQDNPEVWQRYLNLAARPTGISCEYCCGVGPQGIDAKGNSRCGCAHNPAMQTITLWLMMNTDYTDAEILREAMRFKTMFFPKNMITLATQLGGGDTSALQELPGMVGGC